MREQKNGLARPLTTQEFQRTACRNSYGISLGDPWLAVSPLRAALQVYYDSEEHEFCQKIDRNQPFSRLELEAFRGRVHPDLLTKAALCFDYLDVFEKHLLLRPRSLISYFLALTPCRAAKKDFLELKVAQAISISTRSTARAVQYFPIQV